MRFSVLGDFSVTIAGRDVTPRSAKLRSMLALLTIRNGQTTTVDSIIMELWNGRPPERAIGTVHTYVYELRKALSAPDDEPGESVLVTVPHGYCLDLSGAEFDLRRFEELAAQGSSLLSEGARTRSPNKLELASAHLTEALRLWRGEPLANVAFGEQVRSHVAWLEEQHKQVLYMHLHAEMKLERYSSLIGEVKLLIERHPFHEELYEILMTALSRSGRRLEALNVYHEMRERLNNELGLDPGPSLQRLQQALIAGGHEIDRRDPQVRPERIAPKDRLAQLPPDVPDFLGRCEILRDIVSHITATNGTAAPIVCIHGAPGTGKSATAIHVANRVSGEFPDGQIYIDLKRKEPTAEFEKDVFAEILRTLGAADEELPRTLPGLVGVFRALTRQRRILLVLDGAEPHMEITGFLPLGCPTIVTSTRPLHGLAGATMVQLDTFTPEEGIGLLERIVGKDRVDAERETALCLINQVDTLPLTIRFLGERLSFSPRSSIEQLRKSMFRCEADICLSQLERIGLDLFSRLESAYRQLSPKEQTAFLALSCLRANSFSLTEAAQAFSCGDTEAGIILTSLVDAGLVKALDDEGGQTYRLPRFTGLYLVERLARRSDQVGRCLPLTAI
ncbi:BTAD domain-containing putative transcriptional regulator [Microbispora rosea]|uniref:AfsR/SARP family transcriptional regulator n=1 Tax=Microbispora rosea TaxID=58117 RepID=UPI0037C5E32C